MIHGISNIKITCQLKQSFLLCLLLIFPLFLQAQQQLYFEKLTSKNGLSENVVNTIYQDSRGFMWFGTNDGLNKFDGYQFTVYKPDENKKESINSNLIFALTEDHHQRLWVGTTGKGLNYFDLSKETFHEIQHDATNEYSLSSNYIKDLLTDRIGRIWVATVQGLDVITFDEALNPQIQRIKGDNIPAKPLFLFEDKKGNILVGDQIGLYKIILPTKLSDFPIQISALPLGKGKPGIQAIGEDHQGRLIACTRQGVFLQSNPSGGNQFVKISDLTTGHAIVEDENKQIWIGSYSGLYQFNNENIGQLPSLQAHYTTAPENPESIGNNLVKCLFSDKHGLVWLGTNGGGINYFNPNRKPFLHYGKQLVTNGQYYTKLRSIFQDSNNFLWLGTEGGGLFHNQGKGYDTFVNAESSARPFALEEVTIGHQKRLWVGSGDPPCLREINISKGYPTTTTVIKEHKGPTFAILQDQNNTIWLGTYRNGLHRWIPQKDGTFQKSKFLFDEKHTHSLSNNIVRKIFEDSQGNLWIGTGDGLNLILAADKQSEKPTFQVFKHNANNLNSLSHDYIIDIYEGTNGLIWIATLGGGLSCFTPSTRSFKNYKEQSGLPNMSINSVLEDNEGHIWIASNKGLSQLNPSNGNIKNYFNNSGLQAYQFLEGVGLKQQDGALLFGGVNGFNIFYPETIKDNITPPPIVFTDLEILNKKVSVGEKINERVLLEHTLAATPFIELLHKENNFSIQYAGLDYVAANNIQYQYQLEGFDKDWIPSKADSRKAIYTDLSPGDYTLKVKAANQDGYWTEKPSTLQIKVTPPWYRTYFAFIGYVLSLLALMYLFRHYEIITIKEKHELKVERLNKEKREELNQMKLQFFTNISHELRTPLTLILAPLEQLIQKGKTFTQEEIQQQYHFMYKNSKYLLRLVNQLLDFRKLDQGKLKLTVRQGDIIAFINEITEPFQFIATKQQVTFIVESQEVGLFTWFDPKFMEQIIYNLLSNAFKFTPKGGSIEVQLQELSHIPKTLTNNNSKHFLKISIKDSGPGMSKKIAKKIFQRFFKEDGKQENKDGAGIGLAYTKRLVERHYGDIEVVTTLGKGTTFSVILPMDKATFNKQEIDKHPIQQYDQTADPLEYFMPDPIHNTPLLDATNGTLLAELPPDELPLLLFVDDNADIRKFIQEGLKNNFRVILAENGKLGHELALSSLPDLIISDIMMPEMDGIELCQLLKTNTHTSHIPIILLTAKTATENELEGLETGADAYVKKPFKLEILKMQLLNIHRYREKLKEKFRKDIILQPSEITVTSADEKFLKTAVKLVESHMDESEFNVEELTKAMLISRSKLYLKIKALTGQSTSEFIRTVRLKRAIQLLEGSDYTIKEVMFMTGFNTASYFSKCFKQQFGVLPSEYVRGKGV